MKGMELHHLFLYELLFENSLCILPKFKQKT
jgi:hypothetical protein